MTSGRLKVIDADGRTVGSLRAAEARQLVRAGVAQVDGVELKLRPDAQIPREVYAAAGESDTMTLIHETLANFRSGLATAKPIFSGSEPQPVWLRNNSDKITWTCNLSNDPTTNIPFMLPRGADPILVTEEYAWETLKESNEFRKLLGKMKQGVVCIQVITPEEAQSYYESRARATGAKDAAAAYAAVRAAYAMANRSGNSSPVSKREATGNYEFAPPKSLQDLADYASGRKTPQDAQAARPGADVVRNDGLIRTAANISSGAAPQAGSTQLTREEMLNRVSAVVSAHSVSVDPPRPEGVPVMRPFEHLPSPVDAESAPAVAPVPMSVGVRPLVQNLCAQVSRSTPIEQQIDGETFIRALVGIKDLTDRELEFLSDPKNGRYASVVSWAKRELEKRSEPEPDNFAALIDELSATPAA